VNKARLRGGKANTDREREFLLTAACNLALAVLDEALLPLCYGTAIESRKECGERLRRCGARIRAEIAALAQHRAAS
jgi:hypothetical protein